jgi:hypothetical protein
MKKLLYVVVTIALFAACNNDTDDDNRTNDTLDKNREEINALPDTSRSGDTLYRPDTPTKLDNK